MCCVLSSRDMQPFKYPQQVGSAPHCTRICLYIIPYTCKLYVNRKGHIFRSNVPLKKKQQEERSTFCNGIAFWGIYVFIGVVYFVFTWRNVFESSIDHLERDFVNERSDQNVGRYWHLPPLSQICSTHPNPCCILDYSSIMCFCLPSTSLLFHPHPCHPSNLRALSNFYSQPIHCRRKILHI